MENSFNLKEAQQILSNTPKVLRALLANLNDNWINVNEGDNTWSPYDILGHLIHGEKTDWIPRAKIMLSDSPNKTFTPFDRFAQFKSSEGKSIDDLLVEFETLRAQCIEDLISFDLKDEDFIKTGIHPEFGTVNLRQLLSTWIIHDLSHINQMTRVMAKSLKKEAGPWKNYMTIIKP
jgi:hypothetical protein